MSYNWCKFRYGTTTFELSNNLAPAYPSNLGENYYTFPAFNPKYIYTERNVPTTSIFWRSENMNQTDRDSIFAFWDTTLSQGKYDFTVIDNRRRMLFDVDWMQWNETWKKMRGGVHDINFALVSHYGWFPSTFGSSFMMDNTLADHGLDTDSDLSLDTDGTLTQAGGINRGNGYALRMDDNAVTAPIAASGSVSWETQKGYKSISLLFQLDPTDNFAEDVYIIRIYSGISYFAVKASNGTSETKYTLEYYDGTTTTTLEQETDTSGSYFQDVCATYDAINNMCYIYVTGSATYNFDWISERDFLYGTTATSDSYNSSAANDFPDVTTWDTCNLMEGAAINAIDAGASQNYLLMQNAMVIDEYISPLLFNNIRKQWWTWNRKTVGTWPK